MLGIGEGALSDKKIPAGSVEGMTDAGTKGYFGPCPPVGRKHNYRFYVHALKVEKLELPEGSTPGFAGFNFWANSVDQSLFGKVFLEVNAGPRK